MHKTFFNRHWNEFITQEDLYKLAFSGITHLRIPLGYWIFNVEENEPFPDPPKNDNHGQRFYLKRLIKWADQLGLKVLLDIHAAPGSQNGFDNSGRMGPIGKFTNSQCGNFRTFSSLINILREINFGEP